MAETGEILPQTGLITDVSDKLALSVKNSPVHISLPYIYVPENISPNSVIKLKELSLNKEFRFNYLSDKTDRYGNYPAIAEGNNKSLQEELIGSGMAFVYFLDTPDNAKPLFTAEEKARNSKLGIWHSGSFNILDSVKITNDYKKYLNHFVIVEGEVKNIYPTKKNTYLNFGDDWKTDLSVQLENKILKKFPEFVPAKLVGKKIRVRGWLENYNGPFMKIFNPANVEIIK